ncbi:uncharacterized protein LOC105704326 [Orussus abietinus]|uniref:uncharacterized protein LOC105704326 n=1 Tax=Orussus abietinus TaxID=222816 RepID=UPI0006255613|nr:uncharacterized protein LOC105704326 [Orussus abietinus]
MKATFALVLTFACLSLLFLESDAFPEKETKTGTKDVKEPKEIKETATASKDVKDAIKAAKDAKKKKDCNTVCTAEYNPVCAHDPNDTKSRPRTFGSACVLDTHNCEMGTHLVVKNKGECPKTDGVRLS